MDTLSRRRFVHLAGVAAAGTAVAPLGVLNSRIAAAKGHGKGHTGLPKCDPTSFSVEGFGPLDEVLPLNASDLTNVPGHGDLSAYPLLKLPPNFQYTAISIRGNTMSDGNLVPGSHDGMACFKGRRGRYILVRNHEVSIGGVGCLAANGKQYDPFAGAAAGTGGGGTSTIVVDRHGLVVEDYVSLGGTIRNCAGGPTPWGSWITCEENVTTPASDPRATRKHGYTFEVPSELGEAVEPIPLIGMGRMNHEAVSVDPFNGYVYETEDRDDSAYYLFDPRRRRPRRFGDLQRGGTLCAMVIKPGQKSRCTGEYLPITNANGTDVVDTRGTARGAPGSMLPFLGQPLKVRWVRIEDVDPDQDTVRHEAQAKGAALFYRGEGAWYHKGKHYWVCSNAGDEGEGQVWSYDPWRNTASLVLESTSENLLDGPDNMTVGRDGTIYLCEDGSGGSVGDPNYSQRIVGVDANGGLFDFAFNNRGTAEFAGACFSPDSKFMFVNVQGLGITYAISRTDGRPIQLKHGQGHHHDHDRWDDDRRGRGRRRNDRD